jgi:hypothetical protein
MSGLRESLLEAVEWVGAVSELWMLLGVRLT